MVVPVYDGVTQLDFTGPHQFLSRTPGRAGPGGLASTAGRSRRTASPFPIWRTSAPSPRATCCWCRAAAATSARSRTDRFLEEIARLGATARYLTSVCTGSLILGAAGFLRGRRAACHWAWRDLLPLFGAIVDEGRVVRDGNILSGGGVAAGIDFVLALIAELRGPRVAEMVSSGSSMRRNRPSIRAGRTPRRRRCWKR